MKKTIGWILIILGGFFCFVSILCIPTAFFTDDATLEERIFLLIALVVIAFVNRLICRLGFKLKGRETSAPKQCFLTRLGRVMMFMGIGGGVSLAVLLSLVFSVEKWSLVGMMALLVSTAGLILGVIGVIIDKIRREEAAAEEDTKYKCAQPQEDLNDARYQAEQMFQRGGLDREQAYAAYQKELCFPEKNKYVTEKTILSEQIKTGSFSFEMKNTEVSIIVDDCRKHYMRVYVKECCGENNGRPVTTISDYCYLIDTSDGITAANWKEHAHILDRIELQHISYEGV